MSKIEIPSHASSFLWHYIKQFKWSFLTIVICIAIWGANEALFPYFIKLMVDKISITPKPVHSLWETFYIPVVGITITWTAMEIAMRVYGIIEIYLFPAFRARMRQDAFNYVKGQSLDYFINNLAGNIGTRIADIPKSSEYIMDHMLWRVIATALAFIISVIVIAQVSFVFASVIVIWCVIHMGITFYYMKEVNQKVSDHYTKVAGLNGEIIDVIMNAATMRLFARLPFETKRLKGFQDVEIQKAQTMGWCFQKINFLRGSISLGFIFTTIYLLLKGWQDGWVSAGDFPLITISTFNLMGLIWHLSMSLVDMFRDIGTLNGALTLLSSKHGIIDKDGAEPLLVTQGQIEFSQVNFGYKKGNPLFQDLSLKIESGEKVGLVGFSGSGKTSFIHLLLREYNINAGHIFIDKQDTALKTRESLYRNIAVIPQDPSLFHRTIIDNIRYGRIEASDDEVIEAAKKAHCHGFISELEDGYFTVVGERGLKLSGGQRQRLAIARAILKNSPILIMDEATSALDSATEKVIHDSLTDLMKDRTTIVIAHRLSTLNDMDRIIVFDKGKIVEEGNQKQLLNQGKYFSHLWSLQQAGFLPEKDIS